MAVLQPSAYEGIYEMLKERARQTRESPPSTLGVAANVAGRAAGAYVGQKVSNKLENDQQKDLETFKLGLEKELARYKDEDIEGNETYTQEDVNNYFKQTTGIEDDKYIPKLPKGKIKLTPQKLQDLVQKAQAHVEIEKLASQYDETDPKKASALRALAATNPDEAAKQELTSSGAFGKLEVVVDKNSSTGYRYAQRDKAGNITMTALEAPKPTAGNRPSPSLDPRVRADKIRNDFNQRVKDTGLLNKRDAYTGAINALENPSVTNDVNLIYSVAKARDNTGRLSDQDIEQAAKAGNLPGDLQRQFNAVTTTKKLLPDDVRSTLANSVFQLYSNSETVLKSLEKEYGDIVAAEDAEVAAHKPIIDYRPQGDSVEAVKLLQDNNKQINAQTIAIAKKTIRERKKNAKK